MHGTVPAWGMQIVPQRVRCGGSWDPRAWLGYASPSGPSRVQIITFNANGMRSATTKGFFDWFADAGRRRAVPAGNQGAGAPARRRLLPPAGYRAWFRDASTKKGYSGVAI